MNIPLKRMKTKPNSYVSLCLINSIVPDPPSGANNKVIKSLLSQIQILVTSYSLLGTGIIVLV